MEVQDNDGSSKKGSRKAPRPVPVLVPAGPSMPLAHIAPAVMPSTAVVPSSSAFSVATAMTPTQHYQQAHGFVVPFPPAHAPLHHQHQVPAPAHMPNLASLPQFLPTPLVFLNQKLRCGKWSALEEAYAVLLIEYFEKGIIVECENGVTLRSFLSRKLHCSPMRISKKFAGTYEG